jgi:hypothetical protein
MPLRATGRIVVAAEGAGPGSVNSGVGGHDDVGNNPARGAEGRHAEGHGYGLILFASVLLLVVG